jgi:biopolymer transport protein ExbD
MAGGMDVGAGGKSKKKPLDTAINLVPFIDLMAVTISFLLMTAVWTQIGRLQVSNGGGPGEDTPVDQKTVPITLLVTDKELKLTAGGTADAPIAITRDGKGKMDLTRLAARIKELKVQLPDQSAITLSTEDSVRYEDLVRIIDECIGNGLANVSVSPAMG